jgi:hypothetical protein
MSKHLIALVVVAFATAAVQAQDAPEPSAATSTSEAPSSDTEPVKSGAAAKRQSKAGDDAAKADAKDEVKTLNGISILGNQEAPKSLVIVPWKSSEIGEMPGLSRLLDDSVQPIDKEVFMRELDYYEIRSSSR